MSKTYTTCIGMRGERTARGGNDGCRASVQSWDGSVIIRNWYNDEGKLMVRVGTNDGSSCCTDWNSDDFQGTLEEFKKLLTLAKEIKEGKVSITRHREKSNKMKQLEKLFSQENLSQVDSEMDQLFIYKQIKQWYNIIR